MTLVERAKQLAHRAHAGQVDKAGRPYIEHVARVAAADYPEAEVVAWLHDVLEDAPRYASDLEWFPLGMKQAIVCLTRYAHDTPRAYYAGIRANQIALRVKLADVADNADESRLALLDEKTASRLRRKYARAIVDLTEPNA